MNTSETSQQAGSSAVQAALRHQYAYFVYRSMECFAHLATGISRNPALFERRAKLLARSLKLLLRHGHALPDYTQVLPASEALNAALFHSCLCHRSVYWHLLRRALDEAFGDLRSEGTSGDGEWEALDGLFRRAVVEHWDEAPLEEAAQYDHLLIQVVELSRAMRREARTRVAALTSAPSDAGVGV